MGGVGLALIGSTLFCALLALAAGEAGACFILLGIANLTAAVLTQRPHHSIDEHSHPHLIGDVPRIHPELHSTRNAPEAK
jgi:hypothetical protein